MVKRLEGRVNVRRENLAHLCVVELVVFATVLVTGPNLCAQGPPYQTDDPLPLELHHYEFYIFGSADSTPVEMDSMGPAFEFNWGAIPRVQLHAILPFGVVGPLNHPVFAPTGTGLTEFGLTDTELGTKIAFILRPLLIAVTASVGHRRRALRAYRPQRRSP